MNILVINGSPKGGNSNTMALTRAFLEGAGWEDAEIIDAAGAGVKACAGCYGCWTKTPGKCVLQDGMDGIRCTAGMTNGGMFLPDNSPL